jgi:hypothetical protein
MTTALAMTGKKDKGRMSTEMVTTVLKDLFSRSSGGGPSSLKPKKTSLKKPNHALPICWALKIQLLREGYVDQSLLSCCVECLQQRMAVHKQLLF